MTFKQLKAAIKKAEKEGVKPTSNVVIAVQGKEDYFVDGENVESTVFLGQLFLKGTAEDFDESEWEDDE